MLPLDSIDKIIILTKNGTIAIIHALFGTINDELNYNTFETNIFIQSVAAIPTRNDKAYEESFSFVEMVIILCFYFNFKL